MQAALVKKLTVSSATDHEIQALRQAYMSELRENVDEKMQQMYDEADAGQRSSQTFQRWLGDQILLSSQHLSLQFVEEVLSYAMRRLQRQKLSQIIESVQPTGRTEAEKTWLREKASEVLAPLQQIGADLARCIEYAKQ